LLCFVVGPVLEKNCDSGETNVQIVLCCMFAGAVFELDVSSVIFVLKNVSKFSFVVVFICRRSILYDIRAFVLFAA